MDMKQHIRKIILGSVLLSALSAYGAHQKQEIEENPNALYSEESWWIENRDYIRKLVSLLEAGGTVVLAVIGEEFLCSDELIPDPVTRAEFLKRFENDIVDRQTQLIVQEEYFANHPNFAVVDRKAVKKILDELQFQQTGFVTKEMRDQLGSLLGVTHLLTVSSSRGIEPDKPAGYSYTDETKLKLIELKLGKILTMESASCHSINDKLTKWTKRTIYSKNMRDFNFMETER